MSSAKISTLVLIVLVSCIAGEVLHGTLAAAFHCPNNTCFASLWRWLDGSPAR